MRVLIVDDEPPARARLARLLAAAPDVDIVGHAGDGEAALLQAAALAPDVVFLDVQMPVLSGLDLAASLPDPAPAVVFVTAHDRYALQAFDTAAVDYLLKPVEPQRLERTLARLRERLATQGAAPLARAPEQLLIPDRGRTHVIPVAEILWLEAADNYVVVHTAERAPLMRRTLAGLLADLGSGFQRTHRGAAVSVAQVQQLLAGTAGDAGDGVVLLRGGARAPCSRRWRGALLARLTDSGAPPAP